MKHMISGLILLSTIGYAVDAMALIDIPAAQYECQRGYSVHYSPDTMTVKKDGHTTTYQEIPSAIGWNYRTYAHDGESVRLYLNDENSVLLDYSDTKYAKCAKGNAPYDNE